MIPIIIGIIYFIKFILQTVGVAKWISVYLPAEFAIWIPVLIGDNLETVI
jgi:hypothetical protein